MKKISTFEIPDGVALDMKTSIGALIESLYRASVETAAAGVSFGGECEELPRNWEFHLLVRRVGSEVTIP